MKLDEVELIIIYLGNKCNFDCIYCDRGYIENTIGGQTLQIEEVDAMEQFFLEVEKTPNQIKRVSFHGGEPFLFMPKIRRIMKWLSTIVERNAWKVSFTTNGSLVKRNEDFFEEYSGLLTCTVSYDFMYQGINRVKKAPSGVKCGECDCVDVCEADLPNVIEMSKVLNKHCTEWKFQYVMPIDEPDSLSFKNLSAIVKTCYATECKTVNLIPLRHKRGKDKFDVIIDNINLPQFLDAFMEFVQILYVKKLNVFIDGQYHNIDKAYFNGHSKLILAPNGYIYPEFDFLEYKVEDAKIGNWKSSTLYDDKGDEGQIPKSCLECTSRPSCGLKYLYFLFDEEPKGSCVQFYKIIDFVTLHLTQLKTKKNLLEWVGIDENFKIKK
jgi:MoaA/NifB/PqqE/SkfB family radical SAM enzyme